MSRRQAREAALQALFQLDFNKPEGEEQREAYETLAVDTALAEAEAGSLTAKDSEYVQTVVHGTRRFLPEVDTLLAQQSRGWKPERMAAVDRNVARLAIFEMCFAEERLDAGIVINEAVELAKKYGTDDSGRFVNGILDALAKKQKQKK